MPHVPEIGQLRGDLSRSLRRDGEAKTGLSAAGVAGSAIDSHHFAVEVYEWSAPIGRIDNRVRSDRVVEVGCWAGPSAADDSG
jgi:hypothetical protein